MNDPEEDTHTQEFTHPNSATGTPVGEEQSDVSHDANSTAIEMRPTTDDFAS